MEALREVKERTGYLMDPHGAVGYAGLMAGLQAGQKTGIFLETAHPAKFGDVIEKHLGFEVAIPQQLQACLQQPKKAILVGNQFEDLKGFLLDSF